MKDRFYLIDAMRGLSMLSMVAFHFSYDVFMIYGVEPYWYWKPAVHVWQLSICCSFIFISGFVMRFGKNPIKRGLVVSAAGLIISLVTAVFMPSEVIWWGILSFIGGSMLLTVLINVLASKMTGKALGTDPGALGTDPGALGTDPGARVTFVKPVIYIILAAASLVLYFLTKGTVSGYINILGQKTALPPSLYKSAFGIPFGFPPAGFVSSDYFPLLPWYFLFICGYFTSGIKLREPVGSAIKKAGRIKLPLLSSLGKYALPVYMLHQPLCMGLCMLIFH